MEAADPQLNGLQAVKNIKRDVWPGCSGAMTIEDFVRIAILAECPSLLACHKSWQALSFSDIDTSHWPRFVSSYLPASFSELMQTRLMAVEFFLARVAAHWYEKPWVDMRLAEMTPFLLIELIATADLDVLTVAKASGGTLNGQQCLLVWHNSVNRRMDVLTAYIQQYLSDCCRGPHQDCLLRVYFVSAYSPT